MARRRNPLITSRQGYLPGGLSQVGLANGFTIQNGQFVGPDGKPLAPGEYGGKPWTPYQTPQPPPGTYDPNLDIQVSAAGRGLSDLTGDIATAGTRDTTDYLTGMGDIATRSAREGQDYQSSIDMLTRNYASLGRGQAQQQAAAGVSDGGAVLQAAAKRVQNQALAKAPIDQAHARFGEDTTRAQGALALELAPPSAENPLGGRRFQDRGIQLTRGQRENAQFGIDTGTVKGFQAAQSGLFQIPGPGEPGGQPTNEHRDAAGNPYRVIVRPHERLRVDPNGRILRRRRF